MQETRYTKAYNKIRKTWEINPAERVVPLKKEEPKFDPKKVELEDEDDLDIFGWMNDPINNNIE